jgi:hypothetical protein
MKFRRHFICCNTLQVKYFYDNDYTKRGYFNNTKKHKKKEGEIKLRILFIMFTIKMKVQMKRSTIRD